MTKSRTILFGLALLLAGSVALQAAVPSLVGFWKGPGKGVGFNRGYYNINCQLTVTDQTGSLFRGSCKSFFVGGNMTYRFTGVINADNTITLNLSPNTTETSTDSLMFGKYIAPTAKSAAKIEAYGFSINYLDTSTLTLTKK